MNSNTTTITAKNMDSCGEEQFLFYPTNTTVALNTIKKDIAFYTGKTKEYIELICRCINGEEERIQLPWFPMLSPVYDYITVTPPHSTHPPTNPTPIPTHTNAHVS